MKLILEDISKNIKIGEFPNFEVADKAILDYLIEGTGFEQDAVKVERSKEYMGVSEYTLYPKKDKHRSNELKSCQLTILA
tara:strand:- start:1557 stop:1796 length:240 start_codon:yes stop_codon:yes gene_type:complete